MRRRPPSKARVREGRVTSDRPVREEIGERRWSMLDESAQEWIMGESTRERWEPVAVGRLIQGWVWHGR